MTDEPTKWEEPTTEKYIAAKVSLPEELHPHFTWSVQWYQFHARSISNSRMINYAVLAAMVKDGFRYAGVDDG